MFFATLDRLGPSPIELAVAEPALTYLPRKSLKGHVVLVDLGQIGSRVGEELQRTEIPLLVIDERQELIEKLRACGIDALQGNAAATPEVVGAANLAEAHYQMIAILDSATPPTPPRVSPISPPNTRAGARVKGWEGP